jgi:hypothetical protein
VATVSPGLVLKPVASGLLVWASKSKLWLGDLRLKITTIVFLIWTSKSSGLRFVDCATKSTGDEDSAGHTSRSNGLIHIEASWTRVFQSSFKTGGGATACGARDNIAEVA